MATAVTAYIALGSNLQNPKKQLTNACAALAKLPQTSLVRVSSWYQSTAIGPGDQPDYLNGVAALNTQLNPHTLLQALQGVENAQGRVRTLRWGPRTLDLDLLLYGDQVIHSDTLLIPHPRMCERNFVIYPLAEIAADLAIPDGKSLHKGVAISSLLAQLSDEGLKRIED